jgi:hypothetical protein
MFHHSTVVATPTLQQLIGDLIQTFDVSVQSGTFEEHRCYHFAISGPFVALPENLKINFI